MNPLPATNPYKRHLFPAEIISHSVWLYSRFSLSYRDVEVRHEAYLMEWEEIVRHEAHWWHEGKPLEPVLGRRQAFEP